MTPERWQLIKAAWEEADSAAPGARPAILDRLCHDDPDLRREVEQLLSTDGSGTFIHDAIREHAASLDQAAPREE